MKNRIGILGGTFDPIHNGHLWFAESARENFFLEKVIFIPNKIPPHRDIPYAGEKERYEMVLLAISDNPYFDVWDIEIKREGKSYIVETLEEAQKIYKDKEIYLLLGIDAFNNILSWKDPERIVELSNLIVGNRGEKIFTKELEEFIKKFSKRIFFHDFPFFPISAQEIRERIQRGESIKYLVPSLVEMYIYKNKLYLTKK
ncbi:MAG: nicotinate-nucleotide adenylyltransferase [Dictyoglomaceae bacterium]